LRRILALVLTVVVMISSSAAYAVLPDEVMADPAKEARARNLSRELRCMVCQNESIDDSEAPLAHDLRVLVRERLKAGDSDEQIVHFLVARYGEFVLLRPPLSWHTVALWATPPAVLVLGIIMIVVVERRRAAVPRTAPGNLTTAEEARLAEILQGGTGRPS
jgi:cytochrome c-type biogenesis protein CcmH